MGALNVGFLAFPLDAILAALWLIAVSALWRHARKSLVVRLLLSSTSTIFSIFSFLVLCLVIGLTGKRELAGSWIAVVIFLYFQTVLLLVIMRGWRRKTATGARLGSVRWRFLFIHTGLLLAVASAFWGAPDTQTVRVRAEEGIPVSQAYKPDGASLWLDYEICLDTFRTETYSNGMPSMYEADIVVDGEDVTVSVNDPYHKGFGEDIYLCAYDSDPGKAPGFCVLEIVYEPWKYGAVAGIILMLIGALMLFLGGPDRRSVIAED